MTDFLEFKFDLFAPIVRPPIPERTTIGEIYSRIFWMANRRVSWLPFASLDLERIRAQDEELADSYPIDEYLRNMTPILEHNISQMQDQLNNIRNRSIQHLKIEKYDGEACTCSLCLDEIIKDSDVYKLPCNHIFHAGICISEQNVMAWIKEHGTCPYCRAKTDLPEHEDIDKIDFESVN